MQVANIRVRDLENRAESLTLSLQAIARWAGVELHFRSINAALGLSFMITAPLDRRVSLSWWMAYGRDAFLTEAGKLFGLKIRSVEVPATVSAEPGSADAFAEFNSKVKPLIQRALAKNQPVLAWQGWPDYHSFLWGVITQPDGSELGFSGTTMWAGGKVLPLASPPARMYVVEETKPKAPAGDELLRFSIGNIRRAVHNQVDPAFGVETGLRAYDRWLEWLAEDPQQHANGDRTASCHFQMARLVTLNRESACRFIDHYKDGLHPDLQPYLEAMLAGCRGVINSLATGRDLKAVEVLYNSADGREALAAGVHAARDFLAAHIHTIDHLSDKLGV